MPYAIIIGNVLQSEEEEDELVKDEDATKHEIVQDNIKEKVPDEWFWLGKPIEKCNKCCYKSS